MRSDLFEQGNLEQQTQERFVLQNSQMLRVSLGPDVLATKGSMVAFQGTVRFDHEKAGGIGKLAKKIMTCEDVPLMRVSGQGEVFFADQAGYVYLVQLENEAISINGRNLMAFDATLQWDINRTKGAGMASGGLVQHDRERQRHGGAVNVSGSPWCSTAPSSRRTSTPSPPCAGRPTWCPVINTR